MKHTYMLASLKLLFISVLILGFSSCQQTVSLDLHSIKPLLVIDASICNGTECKVYLRQTQDFYDPHSNPTITNAKVILSDNLGQSESLNFISDNTGDNYFYSSVIRGSVGVQYHLSVIYKDQHYEAIAKIPQLVPIKHIFIKDLNIANIHMLSPQIIYDDPKAEKNYYNWALFVNGVAMKTMYLGDDDATNGKKELKQTLFYNSGDNGDHDLAIGDSIAVDMQSLDKGAYQYLSSLNGNIAGGGANPTSNFSGNVLGMFKAYNSDKKKVIISKDIIH